MSSDTHADSNQKRTLGRREVLAMVGAGAVASLAGCEGLQNQSYESSPVRLSESALDELSLGEVSTDSETLNFEAVDGNVSVEITSHAAFYSRAVGIGGE